MGRRIDGGFGMAVLMPKNAGAIKQKNTAKLVKSTVAQLLSCFLATSGYFPKYKSIISLQSAAAGPNKRKLAAI